LTRIGIDYTPAFDQGGGIGRYVRELVAALAQQQPTKHDYHFFVAGATRTEGSNLPKYIQRAYHPTRLNDRWLARLWHRAKIPLPVEHFVGDVDIYHATDFVLPPTRRGTHTLLTVHDLSFVRSPETASPRLRSYLSKVVPDSIRRADHVLADSEATRQDIIDLYGTSPKKIETLLSGVNPSFKPVTDPKKIKHVRRRYDLDDFPFILSVGTIQPRKNYGRLIQSLKIIRDQGHDVHVVIAGGRGWLEDEIYTALDRFEMQPYVHFIGFAADEDLPTLYSAATCSFFVSLYEGFGLPVLESMACGTPVITSNISSLPEVAGDVAPMVDPMQVDEIANELLNVIEDTAHREALSVQGIQHAKRFTWDKTARQLIQAYNRLI
jgi:glycosyltransferase involved in cell wall biosynthesis